MRKINKILLCLFVIMFSSLFAVPAFADVEESKDAVYTSESTYTKTEDDEFVYITHERYSEEKDKMITSVDCYAKSDYYDESQIVIHPIYIYRDYVCHCKGDEPEILLYNTDYLDKAKADAEALNEKLGMGRNMHILDENENGDSYFYNDGELHHIINGNHEVLGPNREELSEEEQIDLLYDYENLSDDEKYLTKKEFIDSIYLQYLRGGMDEKEALSKYNELLGKIDKLSIGALKLSYEQIHTKTLEKLSEEYDRRKEESRLAKQDEEAPQMTDAGIYQELVGDVVAVNGVVPTKINTRVIHDYIRVDLCDDNNIPIDNTSSAVYDLEHTKFKYVYIDQLFLIGNGTAVFSVVGTDDPGVSGNLQEQNYSAVETESGMADVIGYESMFSED